MSPRAYGSNGSTPHSSNGSSYSVGMNGYGSPPSHAHMGRHLHHNLYVMIKFNKFYPPNFLNIKFENCICNIRIILKQSLSFFLNTVNSQSPALPPAGTYGSSLCTSNGPGLFSFTPASMISAAKQKSAFAPVLRPNTSPIPPAAPLPGLQGGWAHPILGDC